jgi:hypothetical protein
MDLQVGGFLKRGVAKHEGFKQHASDAREERRAKDAAESGVEKRVRLRSENMGETIFSGVRKVAGARTLTVGLALTLAVMLGIIATIAPAKAFSGTAATAQSSSIALDPTQGLAGTEVSDPGTKWRPGDHIRVTWGEGQTPLANTTVYKKGKKKGKKVVDFTWPMNPAQRTGDIKPYGEKKLVSAMPIARVMGKR